jgi:ABC-type glycerol-3-phosphate transport system substrate-binding protein
MKWILIAGAALLAIAALAVAIGWMLPVKHVASRSATFSVPPETVWSAITDANAFPTWRSDVTKVERQPDVDGRAVWIEEGSSGRLKLAVEKSDRPRTLVTRIADPDLPFGGAWVYEIVPSPAGCTLTITEQGEIYNPIFRVMARFVFGYEATMAGYLESLKKKLAG